MSNDNPFANSGAPQNFGQQPQYQPAKKNTLWIILIVVAAASIPVMGVCCGLLLPAVQAAREAARRMECSNNMKQIGLALHNYHSAYKTLPPAYTTDANGRPMHSWRTLILPFMEQQALHSRIDFSKPWDDPVNQAVANTVVPAYQCPSTILDPTMTTYVAVADPSGMITAPPAKKFRDTLDGLANTIMIVETDSGNAVHWMSPNDIDMQAFLNAGTARESGHVGGAHVLMGDGAVVFITDSMTLDLREALITRDGGETIE